MKFIKTIYAHEYGQERVTGFGTLKFNHSGVCVIQDDDLAIAVAESSQSLVLAEEDEEAVKQLLSELKRQDEENNKIPDMNEVGNFIKSADSGVAVESTASIAEKTIGTPANDAGDNGSFSPTPEVEAAIKPTPPLIGAPAEDVPVNLIDDSGKKLTKTPAKKAPVAETKSEAGNEAALATLAEFEVGDIVEMLDASDVDEAKYSGVDDKDKLIKIVIEEKIL